MKKIIQTSAAPAAIGPYSQAVQMSDMLISSGQLGIDPKTGEFPEGITLQTEQALQNVEAILKEAGMDMSCVIKTTCFLADMADFAAMNAVYEKHFQAPFPARSAVAVKTLPKNGLVEIEVIAIKK